MSKYRRVSSNVENREKKNHKVIYQNNEQGYVDTKSLMEKLGIKLTNEDIYGRRSDAKKKIKGEANNINTTKIKEKDKYNAKDKDMTSKSVQKRNKKEKNNKNSSSSLDKRLINKEKIQNEIIEKKSGKVEKNMKSQKNIKENNENIIKKKTFKKEEEKISKNQNVPNKNDKKKFKRISEIHNELDAKNIPNKNKKDLTKSAYTLFRNDDNGLKEDDANRTSFAKFIIHPKTEKLKFDEDDEDIKRSQTKKTTEKKAKEKKNDLESKEEKPKKRKNKATSMDKIVSSNKIFDFKSKKNSLRKSKKNSNIESIKNSDDEKILSSDSGSSFDLKDKGEIEIDPKRITRSNKRHVTEMASQKLEFNNIKKFEEKEKEISSKNEKNEKKEEEKEKEKANKKNLMELVPLSKMEETEIERSKKKHLTEITNKSEKKTFRANYLRRRTMLNPVMGEGLDLLVNGMVLKQNGGNSLFLTNFEKGPTYEKEIEIFVRNQNVKKKIKISCCTKAGCSGPGIVKTNQDAYFIKDKFLKNNNNVFLGVCDGHGEKGELISKYVTHKLPEYIKDLNNENITNIFKKINNEIYNNKSFESNMSGTTVISLFLTTDKIMCVNLGDSRAALFKYDNGLYYCKNLSRDHKPSEPDENKRIINNNGRVKKCYDEELKKYLGPDRVWVKNKEEPGLAMTRSIGDKVAHTVGVSDEPEFKNFTYDGTEKFLIIASDGIWEYLHGDDCIKIIRPFYEENKDWEEAAFALVKEAFRKWKRKEVAIDDITAIVVFFDN